MTIESATTVWRAQQPKSYTENGSCGRRSTSSGGIACTSSQGQRSKSASQIRVNTDDDAPMRARAESTYRYTVIDTIGGGTSEVQKNIIARRKLGLPKNF